MHPGRKPPFGNILVFMAGQAEERVAGGKPDDAEGRDRHQDEKDGNDKGPCSFG
jgi:hypothetical protein